MLFFNNFTFQNGNCTVPYDTIFQLNIEEIAKATEK